ncbi:hypothetical protein [Pseudolactococcus reticulitermitis]|uniref:Gram-positive cocci surface proteins LPxTG domain-containing protein n=1 Tax=Pseudolactococcus reticulitermitis TaxID=2025039 RepID=A0A224X0M7_9LACT|nr:hypothetical protein [Lactococcus reticulitermitis]GAX46506.1 hypothetical protein RsY01_85 [Lactococcus reticulitermitis]
MESEITVSGQLGITDTQDPIEEPELPRTSGDQTIYTVHQQGILPDTGELQTSGSVLFIGLLCLIVVLIFRIRSTSKSLA